MKYVRSLLLLMAMPLLSGCVAMVMTTQPLSDPVTGDVDKALFGHWVAKDTATEDHVFIVKGDSLSGRNPDALMSAQVTHWNFVDHTALALPAQPFTVSRVGTSGYLNLLGWKRSARPDSPVFDKDRAYPEWIRSPERVVGVLKYSVSGNRLTVWAARDAESDLRAELKKLADERKLKVDDDAVSIESLVRYLRANDGAPELFARPIEFERVR